MRDSKGIVHSPEESRFNADAYSTESEFYGNGFVKKHYIDNPKALIIICPGGAYSWRSPREGIPVAEKFNKLGYSCEILHYTCSDGSSPVYPRPQTELAMAISAARKKFSRIIVMGFSAGGHLAASLAVMPEKYGKNARPDCAVLCYPVITSGEKAHVRSISNLVGNNEELIREVSLEKHVDGNTCPCFIWTTATDESVPFENSLMFKQALDKYSVLNELVVFDSGVHGLSLGTADVSDSKRCVAPQIQKWPELASEFIERFVLKIK